MPIKLVVRGSFWRRRTTSIVGVIVGLAVSSFAAPSAELHHFYGKVLSVDLPAKTFRIKTGGRTLVFHYDERTKISSFYSHVSWDKIKPGQGAAVAMRVGENGAGLAVQVRFDFNTNADKAASVYVVRTTSGQTISGVAVGNYVAYEPPGDRVARATGFGSNSSGVFVLSVKPDGSVGKITAAKSLNSAEANERAAVWLRKWRFKPNSVTQVQMPVGMWRSY